MEKDFQPWPPDDEKDRCALKVPQRRDEGKGGKFSIKGREKMRDTLLLLFGAILAVLGSFLTHLYQNWLNQKSKDRELLYQAGEILVEIQPFLGDLPWAPEEIIEPSKKLLYFAMRIRSKRYSELAYKLIEFSRMDIRKTIDESIKLIQEIASISKSPLDRFHKKQNEIYKKAWEELKRIGRG